MVKATATMLAAGAIACVVLGVLIVRLLTPTPPPALAEVPPPATAPATPAPDLVASEVEVVRVTEPIHATQMGDSTPVTYSTPRVMQAGVVMVQLTRITASGGAKGWEEIDQAYQAFRFDLVDALTGETIGTADVTRQDGADSEPALLATLTEPRATYLRVSAEVRGSATCRGCETGDPYYDTPIWHTWHGLLQYEKEDHR